MSADYKLTVSLSSEERIELEALAEALKLSKTAVVRRILAEAARRMTRLPQQGRFLPFNSSVASAMPIRLVGEQEARDA